MLRLQLSPQDLAESRFAVSPLLETVLAVHVLREPAAHVLHAPWAARAAPALAGLDHEVLDALLPPGRPLPSFLPLPRGPSADLAGELERLRALDPARARAELAELRRLAPAAGGVLERPAEALERLADALADLWARGLAADWPRLRALAEGDVLRRAHDAVRGGLRLLLEDLHPRSRLRGDVLQLDAPGDATLAARGRGLVLVPTAFAWPDTLAARVRGGGLVVCYPPRGLAELWTAATPDADDPLAVLLGRGRAAVVHGLRSPCSTSELAARLGVTPGAVSQHLRVLLDAGLVDGARAGRSVLYRLSPSGRALVQALAREREGDGVASRELPGA